ncbi:MAG: hypothetical protein NE327_10625 [Lentisphaeraceae bacterium]|nr:hypothetical protein [Lentisphaeraceae bacterium]
MKDFLFDIDQYKKGQVVYQVRLFKNDDMNDQGEIMATFTDMSLCLLFDHVTCPEGYHFNIIELEEGRGITDLIEIGQVRSKNFGKFRVSL